MAVDLLRGVNRKIERADKHIVDLQSEITAFLGQKPYAIGIKHDPDTGENLHCLTGCADIPDVIPLIVGDAVSCLRSALDQLAYQIWIACGRRGRARNVYFPIFDGRAKYIAGFADKIEGARQNVRLAFDAIQPYKGGNGHDLWVVQALNNTDKHRLLISAGSAFQCLQFNGAFLDNARKAAAMRGEPGVCISVGRQDRSFPLALGDVLCRTVGMEMHQNSHFTFDLAFNEPGIIEGEPLVKTLPHLANVVRNVVSNLAMLV